VRVIGPRRVRGPEECSEGTSPTKGEVRQIAVKAQGRPARKFRHLAYDRHKPPCVVVTAVARELAGFVWATTGQQPRLLAP